MLKCTMRDGRLLLFEYARIAPTDDGRLAFRLVGNRSIAQPNGAPPTAFPRVEMRAQSVGFASPAHVMPSRIRYRLIGQALEADIADRDGKVLKRWTFRPR